MACSIASGALVGVDGVPVTVEVDTLRRLPSMVIVGLAGGAVKESADRVRSALDAAGFDFPRKRVVVNLAPADLKKQGTAYDLPIAIGLLAVSGQVSQDKLAGTGFVGELSLEGRLRRVAGALPLALLGRAQGWRRIVVPRDNAAEAAVVTGIEVLAADSLAQVAAWLNDEAPLPSPAAPAARAPQFDVDLSEVRGQARARRALEVAAAGGHNLLLLGSPGCGKTMLAARLPTILPTLGFAEAVEITRVWSVAGLLGPDAGLLQHRPFRAPHHSITAAGMGGSARLRPGEISLAHHGVLFLDELPEFRRNVLELLRQPLETREICIERAQGTVRFPANLSLVTAANPCPCGFSGHPKRACRCTPGQAERYRSKLSGPLLDRIDLQVWVQPVDPDALVSGPPGEDSATVRTRVEAARARQRARFGADGPASNAALQGDAVRTAADPTPAATALLQRTLDAHALSARAFARILKVARTLADLDAAGRVDVPHVLEAASYRTALQADTAGP